MNRTKSGNGPRFALRIRHRKYCHLRVLAITLLALYVICFCWTFYYNTYFQNNEMDRNAYFVRTRLSPLERRQRRRLGEREIPILLPLPGKQSVNNGTVIDTTSFSFIVSQKPFGRFPLSRDIPDFGGLIFHTLSFHKNGRTIHHDPHDDDGHVHDQDPNKNDDDFDPYYAYDDDQVSFVDLTCRYASWHLKYYPSCNAFHEFPLLGYKITGRGHYRDTWLSIRETQRHAPIALKTNRYRRKFGLHDLVYTRHDAMVMERLTSSPRIADVYGHCGTSVITEAFASDLESKVVPTSGFLKMRDDGDEEFRPRNDIAPTEKLAIALRMAECLADLHGFRDGVIVHDDVQLAQWLYGVDGELKLNDFNRAEIMLWDEGRREYCKYDNEGGAGQFRAPEQFTYKKLDEKIDVFTLGNLFYALLTGLWNFYEDHDDEVIQKKVIKGEQPFIDERYRTRSYAEGALVKVIEQCLVYDPKKRPDIFKVVQLLRLAVEENGRLDESNKVGFDSH